MSRQWEERESRGTRGSASNGDWVEGIRTNFWRKDLHIISFTPSPLSHDGSARNLRMELLEMFDMDQTLSGLYQRGRTKAYES